MRIEISYNQSGMIRDNERLSAVIIHMKDVSWICGDKYILRDINWTVKKGEHWAIVGLNGSGKTTLLSLVSGYVWPSHGEISVLEKRFGSYDIRELRKKIGWVSSSLQEKFYVNETAEEIVLSGKFATIGLYDIPKSRDAEHAMMLLSRLKCEHTAAQPYWTLSQGEKQKVLIARALISSPPLLILDEPCAGLDIFSREQLLSLIEDIGRQESAPTLLYVSHRIEEILPVFTHTLLLRRGEVHSQGRSREVLTKRNLSDFLEMTVDVRRRKERVWLRI
jgi:iron complex transport system ATP-binding protein